MKNKSFKFLFYYFFSISIFFISCSNFAAGSYPYAEEYIINADNNDLISAIDFFKKNNPQYIVPSDVGVLDGKKEHGDYWYNIYFFYPEENQIVFTWVRAEEKNQSTFALVSINNGQTLGNWKDINKDFSRAENIKQKKNFEDRILKKVKEILLLKKITGVPNK